MSRVDIDLGIGREHGYRDPRRVWTMPTPRQRQILTMLAAGHRHGEIAVLLGMSPATVQTHIADLRDRLGAHTIGHAVHIGHARGLLRSCAVCGTPTDGAAECDACAIREETVWKRREDA